MHRAEQRGVNRVGHRCPGNGIRNTPSDRRGRLGCIRSSGRSGASGFASAPRAQRIGLAGDRGCGRPQVRERHIGQQRFRRHRQQMGRGIEYLLALAAAHPSFRDAQLVRHDLEGGGAGRAAGDLAHQRWIVEAMPRPPEQRSRTFNGVRSSESSHPRCPPLPAAARARRPP